MQAAAKVVQILSKKAAERFDRSAVASDLTPLAFAPEGGLMVAIPVYCPHCGAIFRSRGLSILGSPAFAKSSVQKLTLGGNRETCISCGKMANIVDGVFDTSKNALKLLQGPQITVDVLRAFSEILQRAHDNTITPDELQTEAEKLNPELGKAVAEIRKRPDILTVATVFLIVAFQTCDFKLETKVDLNQLLDQAFAIVEHISPSHSPPEDDSQGPGGNKKKGGAAGRTHRR